MEGNFILRAWKVVLANKIVFFAFLFWFGMDGMANSKEILLAVVLRLAA